MDENSPDTGPAQAQAPLAVLPGPVVLVLQGGGALGAYQVGVYQAVHEAGLDPTGDVALRKLSDQVLQAIAGSRNLMFNRCRDTKKQARPLRGGRAVPAR